MGKVFRGKVVSAKRQERRGDDTSKLVYPEGSYGASLRNIRIAPNKVRLVVDLIRGEPVDRAKEILRYSPKKAAYLLDRVLTSALGNAVARSEGSLSSADLFVSDVYCDEGSRLKRFKPGPMGRSRPILRRMAHITVKLSERQKDAQPEKKARAPKKEKAAK